MATYYKHTKTESIDVPYSFRCEQCMQESGRLKATISGAEATINSNFKQLNEKNQKKLNELAHTYLVKAVKEAYRDVTEKQIYCTDFKDQCPHCKKPQSWAVSGVKQGMFTMPIAFIVVGIIIGVGGYFFSGVDNNLVVALVIGGIFAVLAAGSLIWNIVKVESKKKQTATVAEKHVPVIEWGAVQHILNEQ